MDVDKSVIARLKNQGTTYEILVDCDRALDYKGGKEIPISDILASEQVFSDAKKGLLASESQMQAHFRTSEPAEVAKEILRQGEVQITAEHRARLREQKLKRIIDMIHTNGMDPRTKLPHPRQRIELAFEEAKIRVDENKSADEQVEGIIKQLRPVLPISVEQKKVAIKFPPLHAGKGYSAVQNFGSLVRDDWQTDGSYVCVVQIPAGLQSDLIDRVNKITHGDVEVKIIGE